jgi:hypothetical protein
VKLAVCFGQACPDATATVARMLRAQAVRTWHETVSLTTPRGTLGSVRTSDRFSRIPSVYSGPQARLLVAGVPVSLSTPVAERLQRATESDWDDALRCLTGLDGAFAAVMWHETARKLAIVTDILGMQPVYVHRRAGLVAIASEVSALTSAGLFEYAPDPAGWGAFLLFGHTIADRTLALDVTRMPAASITVYEPDADRLTVSSYWAWPQAIPAAHVDDSTLDGLGDQIVGELRACLTHHPRPVLCLSGGYDSRLILAALDEIGHTPIALTLSHPDEQFDLDGKLANRVARAFQLEVITRTPDGDFFSSDAYLDYVRTSGLASPSLYLFIAQLASRIGSDVEAIWDGIFPGCALFPVHQHPGGFEAYLKHAAPTDNPLWIAAQQLFQPEFVRHVRTAFLEALAVERARYSDDELGVSQFVVLNRTRHRIAANPLQAFSNDVIPLTPGSSRVFWTTAAAIPTAAKRDHRLYRRLFERRFPKALRVPAVSAGAIDLLTSPFDGDVLMARIATMVKRRPRVSAALARFGVAGAGPFWKRSTHLETSVQALDADDGMLNRAAVERLRAAAAPFDGADERQRELLFYWWMSRQMFTDVPTAGAATHLTTRTVIS